jgi:hypothetical protein
MAIEGEVTERIWLHVSCPLLFCLVLRTFGKNDKSTLNSAWGKGLVRILAYALQCRTFVSEYVLETPIVTDDGSM